VNPNTYCTHADCRAHAADELRFIAQSLHRPELIVTAAIVAKTAAPVRCRHVPRKGPPVHAPLPGEAT